jgi:uncharacterized protein YoxC
MEIAVLIFAIAFAVLVVALAVPILKVRQQSTRPPGP